MPARDDSAAEQRGLPTRESLGRSNLRRGDGGGTARKESAQPILARPRLLQHLDEALRRRLTIVLADAGFGKSVTLGAWAMTVPCVWYGVGPDDASLAPFVLGIAASFRRRLPFLSRDLRAVIQTSLGPEGDESGRAASVAALLCDALERELVEELALVFDDVHELGRKGPSVRLLEELCRQAPDRLHIVVSTRSEPPFPVQRLRGRGEVLDLDGGLLAFTEEEVEELLTLALGEDGKAYAERVHALTGGWPAAVRLTAEALRTVPEPQRLEALEALHRPGGRLLEYVAEEVFGRAPRGVRELLRRVAPFERFSADLCRALGATGAVDSLRALRRAGFFLESRGTDGEWFGLHALIRDFVRDRWPLDEDDFEDVHRRAAEWFQANECFDEALECLLALGDPDAAAALLEANGPALLAAGRVELIIRAAQGLPRRLRSDSIEQLIGEAHEIRGEWDEALMRFEKAAARSDRLEAGLAWRLGLIHHLRGRLAEALEIYERGRLDTAEPRDAALLLAWKASAHWLRGDVEKCRLAAEEAFTRASAAGDPRALAAAHTTLGMLAALTGDRLANDAHYERALEYAERGEDALQAMRVRTNRGSRHLEEGEYEEAIEELEVATQLGDLTGFVFFRALALTNRGDAHFRLGRLEEARADLEASRLLYQRAGSRMICYPLAKLGDLYRRRGDLALAQASYEEAIICAEASGDAQGLVPALAGLARSLVIDDPERAVALADRAVSYGEGMAYVSAQLAAGWVALARDDRERATVEAEAAARAARLRRDRAGLAEALELRGLATNDRRRQAVWLEEAVSIWRAIRDPLGEAHAELILGLSTREEAGAARAEEAERRLRAAGAHGYRILPASGLPSAPQAPLAPIKVSTLGRFGVVRDGRPLGRDEWKSKKARDLLKLLVARRGRPTPRDVLMEALWPQHDPKLLANRLSVALSTLRSVLDPDRRHPSDHFLVSSAGAIGLRSANVEVDVETFIERSEQALDSYRNRPDESLPLLEAAEAAYVGDFLEEDLYEDWATPLREEARAQYLAVVVALAETAEAAGQADAAIRYRLRALERDSYDEGAHLGLVAAFLAAGRHGEARRAYREYAARLEEIGVEPEPFSQGERWAAHTPAS